MTVYTHVCEKRELLITINIIIKLFWAVKTKDKYGIILLCVFFLITFVPNLFQYKTVDLFKLHNYLNQQPKKAKSFMHLKINNKINQL